MHEVIDSFFERLDELNISVKNIEEEQIKQITEDIVEEIQNLANLKNLSFNKTIISLLNYSLDNIDENDKLALENMKN